MCSSEAQCTKWINQVEYHPSVNIMIHLIDSYSLECSNCWSGNKHMYDLCRFPLSAFVRYSTLVCHCAICMINGKFTINQWYVCLCEHQKVLFIFDTLTCLYRIWSMTNAHKVNCKFEKQRLDYVNTWNAWTDNFRKVGVKASKSYHKYSAPVPIESDSYHKLCACNRRVIQNGKLFAAIVVLCNGIIMVTSVRYTNQCRCYGRSTQYILGSHKQLIFRYVSPPGL